MLGGLLVASASWSLSASSSAVEFDRRPDRAPLVTAVAVARDRTEVEPLAVAGPLGRFEPDRWRSRCELPVGSATMAAIEAGSRSGSTTPRRFYSPGRSPVPPRRRVLRAFRSPVALGVSPCCTRRRRVSDEGLELLETVAPMVSKRWPAAGRRRPPRSRRFR